MLKKVTLLSILVLSALPVWAESEFKVDLKDLDTTKYCVYDKGVYSIGSIVKMGDQTRECQLITSIGHNPEARWARPD